MSKEDFIDQLAYGTCNGSVELVSPRCVEGSPGKKPGQCPVKVVDGFHAEEECNCCDKCRSNCQLMAQIKEATKREAEKSFHDMQVLAHRLEEGLKNE